MVSISACVIVKNEEKNILHWIQNMMQVASELIIVDTGSTDNTVSLVKESSARVYKYLWKDDFAAAKNFALQQATGEWIIFLDADEYFSEMSIKLLPDFLEQVHINKNVDALVCNIINIDTDQNNKVITLSQNIRVFRHIDFLKYEGKVHEKLIDLRGAVQFFYANKEFEIYHTGYSSHIIKEKLKRNLEILKTEIALKGEQPYHYEYLMDCYYGLKDYRRVVEYAEKSIATGLVLPGREGIVYRCLLEAVAYLTNDIAQVMEVLESAITKFPQYPEFVWRKAELLILQRKEAAAEAFLLKAVDLQSEQKKCNGLGQLKNVAKLYGDLGGLFQRKGDYNQALKYYKKSLSENPLQEGIFEKFYELLRGFDAVDVIEILQTIYGRGKTEIEFLKDRLQAYPLDKVYLYYLQQAFKMNNKVITNNIAVVSAHIIGGLYEEAFIQGCSELKKLYKERDTLIKG